MNEGIDDKNVDGDYDEDRCPSLLGRGGGGAIPFCQFPLGVPFEGVAFWSRSWF